MFYTPALDKYFVALLATGTAIKKDTLQIIAKPAHWFNQ
jgi:hypothetical protein